VKPLDVLIFRGEYPGHPALEKTDFYATTKRKFAVKLRGVQTRVESEIRRKQPVNEFDAQVWFEKGIFLSKSQHYRRAVEAFSKALEIDPRFAKAYYFRCAPRQGKPTFAEP